MEQKYGKLVWTDIDDFQQSFVKDETESFLEEMGVDHAEQEIKQITDVFMCNGKMRGRIFFNKGFYSPHKENGSLRLPVYGVKGEHRVKSVSNYSHWYIGREEELLGAGFFNTIFGTCFGTEEEYRTLKKPEEMFRVQQDPDPMMSGSGKSQEFPFIYAMESLWTALEKDPSARFVIVLPPNEGSREESEKKAEENSLDILWQLYLMMPQRLRLTMGFAICVTPQEMIDLAETKDLPIHLFTTNADSDLTILNKTRFFYHVFRISEDEEYKCDKVKYGMLKKLLEYEPYSRLEELLDRSEEAYLQKENKAIGFDAYEEILDPIIVPWYEKDKDNDLIKLLQYRELQEPILAYGNLEKERRNIFLGEILPQKKYGNQLTWHILKHIMNPDEKTDILEKCREKLGLGFFIDAMRQLSTNLKNFYNREKESLQNKIQELEKEKGYSEEQILKLNAENREKNKLINQLDADKKAKDEEIDKLSKDGKEKDEEIDKLSKDKKAKDDEIVKLNKDKKEKDEEIDKLSKYNKEKDEEIDKLSKDNKEKDKQIADLDDVNKAKDKRIFVLGNDNKEKEDEIVKLNEKIKELQEERQQLQDKNEALEEALTKKENLAEYFIDTKKLEDKVTTQDQKIQKLEKGLENASAKIHTLENEVSKFKEKNVFKKIKMRLSKKKADNSEE